MTLNLNMYCVPRTVDVACTSRQTGDHPLSRFGNLFWSQRSSDYLFRTTVLGNLDFSISLIAKVVRQ